MNKLKKVKWYRWLLLGIWLTALISGIIASDIVEETLKAEKLEISWLPYINNYYDFFALCQLIHIVILFTLIGLTAGYTILKGISKDVKKETK